MYISKLTSQGTITLPKKLREKFELKTGDPIPISDDGRLILSKPMSIKELQEMNKKILKKNGIWGKVKYKQGDGWTAHVLEKYGKK